MKKILTLICTLLCANVLLAQTFWVDNLRYGITTSANGLSLIAYVNDANSNIVNATIPGSVTYNGLTYNVEFIGHEAFKNCVSLTSVTIPDAISYIEDNAFENCNSLTSITIPENIDIGDYAFKNCSSLTSVTILNGLSTWGPSIGDGAFYNCSSLTSVTIPNRVTSIGNSVFYNCSSLTSVTIPNKVTSIGNSAFEDCSSLTSITIPNNVTSIGNEAFYNCSSLTSVTIGNSVTSIGRCAFRYCSSLTSVTIPNSVTSFGYSGGVFAGCSSLTSVTLSNNITSLPSFNNVGFFEGCSSLTSIDIPNGVTSIENNAFKNCSSLTSITIPNSVTTIGDIYNNRGAFENCSSLTSVTIGNSVTSIGGRTFNGCSSLTSVTCLAENPPALSGSTIFSGTPNEKSLIVPCSAFDNYINSDWNDYYNFSADRITGIGGYNIVANVNNSTFGSVTIENYCSTATLTANANACYQFVGWNDGNTENPRIVTLSSDTTLTANFGVRVNDIITSICQGQVYNENGFNVSEAGTYTQTLQTANGCDSIVTLTLNVNPIFNTELSATICEGQVYNENGFNVSEAGVYTQSLQTINGCDSIVTLTLNVNPTFNTEFVATICEGTVYNENGFNVSEAGTYTQTHTAANGCDSLVILRLSTNPILNTEITAIICEDSIYTENGFEVSEAGIYTQTHTAFNGCDSIVTLTLLVTPKNTEIIASICEGETYSENGFNITESGIYTQNLQTENGCDSIVTLTLNVNPTFDTIIYATINSWETYMEHGFNESEAGTYVQNLQTVNGCDSIIKLNLTIDVSLMDVEHSELSFYPNPTDSKITFSSTIESIEVIDLTGRCVLTFSNAREINIESLPAGVYHLRLTIEDKTTTRKIIKE